MAPRSRGSGVERVGTRAGRRGDSPAAPSPRPARHGAVLAAAAAFALLASVAPSPAPAQERWPEESWNPSPLPEDLVLPLPCGGAMAFRPVPTPVARGGLADRQATLGQADPETNYSEYLRQAFVAGPFPGPRPESPPRYYLAKYEVTRDQYAAVTAETCPAPSTAGRQPQADVAWHEAVAFAVKLSAWLARNARDALPQQDGARAFVRLPTEEEWEYAARGGAAVSEADFGARTFPMPDGMQRHVWFQGTRSAGNRTRPVGMLEPNPLGLFDILGNVSEWVLEPYRLNKVGRPHGQAGGMVARGGDYLTPESQIRSSLRVELPPLDRNGEPLRLRSVGFRPALALVATTSDQKPDVLRQEFEQEAQSRSTATEDPARLLEVLRNETPDPALRRGIDRVGAALRTETRERREQESQAIRSQIASAAQIGRQVMLADGFGELLGAFAGLQADTARAQRELAASQEELAAVARDQVQAALKRQEEKTRQISAVMGRMENAFRDQAAAQPRLVQDLAGSYLRAVLSVGRAADRLRIADEGNVVLQEFQAQAANVPFLQEIARVAIRHMVAVSNGNPPSREQAVGDLIAVRDQPGTPPVAAPRAMPPAAPQQRQPPQRR